jgi:hypothetical protein
MRASPGGDEVRSAAFGFPSFFGNFFMRSESCTVAGKMKEGLADQILVVLRDPVFEKLIGTSSSIWLSPGLTALSVSARYRRPSD